MKTHYFLAAALPGFVKEALYEWRREHELMLPFQSWVHKEDYHITLAFLGDVPADRFAPLRTELEALPSSFSRFSLSLNGLHTFGVPERPRILWAGVSHSPPLFHMQRNVHAFCERIGFSLETRPYCPHITLARRWKGEADLRELQKSETAHLSMEYEVHTVVLYRTNMEQTPKYEPIFSAELARL